VKNRTNLKTLFGVFLLALSFNFPYHCFAQGDQTRINVKVTPNGTTTGAWLHLPDDYNNTTEKYPLIIFLHGVGEGSGDLSVVLNQGLPKAIANGAKMNFTVGGKLFKFIVVSPQIMGGYSKEFMIKALLEDLKAKYRIDESRVYLTGLSAGGGGTWNYASYNIEDANTLAAMVPVSPSDIEPAQLDNLCNTVVAANVRVWQFSGGGTGGNEPFFRSKLEIYEKKYNSCNPSVKAISTIVSNGGHGPDTWDVAYDVTHKYQNPNIYEWMLQYSKGGTVPPPANKPPVANAGSNATITLPVNSVSLNGNASTDADGTIASYKWAQISGPSTSTLTPNNAAKATASNLVAGSYIYELTVTDDKGATATARVTITVNAANITPPVVTLANTNISITAPTDNVVLDGSASSAPNSTISSYKWEKLSGPTSATIVTPTAAKVTVNSLVTGDYVFRLTVTNAAGISSSANVAVNVKAAVVTPPKDCNCKHVIKGNTSDGGIYSNGQLQNAQPGDTICIEAGTYPYIQFFNYTGTAEKPLVFINCGGQVRVTGGNSYGFIFNQCKYFKVSGSGSTDKYGFFVSGTKTTPLSSGLAMGKGCTDYEAERVEIAYASAGVLAKINPDCDPMNQYPNFAIRNLSFHDLYVHDIVGEGLYIGNTLPNGTDITCADGSVIRALPPRIYNLKIFNVVTRNTGWDGIQVASAPVGVEIFDNEVYNFGVENKGSQQAGIIMGGESQGVIYNNKVIGGTGNGIQVFGTGLTTIYNNIISDAGWDGTAGGQDGIFVDDRPTKNNYTPMHLHLFNNTIVNSKRNGLMILTTYGTVGPDNLIYNNLIVGVGSTAEGDRAYVNIMKGVEFKSLNNLYLSTIAAAGFKDAANKDFHLVAGSPAIDKGMDLTSVGVTTDIDGDARPYNKIFDIGADEYTAGTSTNKPPVARAGNDLTITLPTNSVQLDGSASTDPDGTIKSYGWVKISGPAATITTPSAARSTVTGMLAGTYVFELTVTDDKGATAKDRITITVNPAPNQPPVANAGSDITIKLPTNSAQLDGSASKDPDGTIKSYSWAKVSGPAATITTPTAVRSTVTGLVEGTYVFELTVTDNQNATAKARVKVTVNGLDNLQPVADAGSDITITLPTNSVQVNGSASNDPDGTITAYKWVKISGPAATIAQPNSAISTISGLVAGVYVFELTVTDNKNAVASARVTVTVKEMPSTNEPPMADAGFDRTVDASEGYITLDGSGSHDPDGTIVKYVWQQISGTPNLPITSPNKATTFVTGIVAGVYQFKLTVTDNKGSSTSSTVTITVTAVVDHSPFKVALFPNPATDNIRLTVNRTFTEYVTVFIFNMHGSLQQTYTFGPGVQIQQQIDISTLAQGIYLLQITNGKNIKEVIKFVKS
jgi:hypothetical protein